MKEDPPPPPKKKINKKKIKKNNEKIIFRSGYMYRQNGGTLAKKGDNPDEMLKNAPVQR